MFIVGYNMHDINVLKRKFPNSFEMKVLGIVKKILGMRIKNRKK